VRPFCLALILASVAPRLPAQNLAEFEKRVTEFTLANGLHFIVVERHEAPVVSFRTYVNAGSVDDPSGQTGMAHMFEHMAFKGTESIGTNDWPAEKKELDAVEEVLDRVQAERNKGPKAEPAKIASLEAEWKMAIERAQAHVVPNQFAQIIEENGGVDLNAQTSYDSTQYHYSLPSNRLELWFLLESQRFLHPAFREFYQERNVVMEENRQSVESSPQGKLLQNLLSTAFAASPYRNPPVGWVSDLASLRSAQARAFFEKYYVPANMTMAVVGDVNPAEARRLAERYFSPLPARPLPPLLHTTEPPQAGPRTAEVYSNAQPFLTVAYKRPDMYDKDDPVFDVIRLILARGRTGLLYKQLVEEKRLSIAAELVTPYPDGRYSNLVVFFLVPSQGHTVAENQKALDELLIGFEAQTVDDATLARAKNQARATVLRGLANNAGLAAVLAQYQASYGDWRKLFTSLDDLNKVTAAAVQRVARKYFVGNTRTVAFSGPPAGAGTGGAQ